MITTIVIWLQNLIIAFGPVGILIATCIESFFAPIPSEAILIATGTILDTKSDVFIYSLSATMGSYIGTLPFYFIGRQSRDFVYSFFGKYGKYLFVSGEDIDMAETKFKKYGRGLVFFGRLVPIIRSLISIPAGISKMDLKTYTLYTLAGSLIWNSMLISAGFSLRDRYESFLNALDRFDTVIILILAVLFVIFITNHIRTHFVRSTK